MTTELRVEVSCEDCGRCFDVSRRYARQIRSGEYRAVCTPCRRPLLTYCDAERSRYRTWWLERFSRDEIVEMGRSMLPGRPLSALTASADDLYDQPR